MKAFPMFMRTTGRRVVIVGGGEQAAQKTRLLLKTDADLVLIAPELDYEMQAVVADGRAQQETHLTPCSFDNTAMAFIATGCPGLDAAAQALAKAARCPVNVVDRPDLCDMTTPAIVDRDPIVVAIGSEGTAPVLTRQIKTQLERSLPQTLGGLAALAGRMRPSVARSIPQAKRRAFWAWVFKGVPCVMWTQGAERQAARDIKSAIAAGRAPDAQDPIGHIALVGAGPGARDLLTLRAVERLQEADVIFYDRLVDEEVLELARRDAERVFVGKYVGAHAWPQDRINRRIVAEAQKGRRVVRLKSGDPGIFGRATEEINAARKAGIPVELVPGVTAATAAGAALGQSLTKRNVSDILILSTASGCARDPEPDALRHSGPGTTTAVYMGARHAARMASNLMAKGLSADTPVSVAVEVSKKGQTLIETPLGQLAQTLEAQNIDGCALIVIQWPKESSLSRLASA